MTLKLLHRHGVYKAVQDAKTSHLVKGLSRESMILKQDMTNALSTEDTASFTFFRTKRTASGTNAVQRLFSTSLDCVAPGGSNRLIDFTVKMQLCTHTISI